MKEGQLDRSMQKNESMVLMVGIREAIYSKACTHITKSKNKKKDEEEKKSKQKQKQK